MWSQGSVVPSYSKVTGLKETGKSSYVLREWHSPNSHRFLPYIPPYFSEFSLKVFHPLRQLIICTFVSMRGANGFPPHRLETFLFFFLLDPLAKHVVLVAEVSYSDEVRQLLVAFLWCAIQWHPLILLIVLE